ncbi:MAG: SMP-30/gluconolactonase/LRE family protein [Vicinamibacterales bacterium]
MISVRYTASLLVLSGGLGWTAQAPVPRDLTAEHLFTNNIEGPDVDRSGRLFVVNVEKDGTIGLVHPDGKVEKFVDLPAGSTANAIKFNRAGMMLLADYTGHNVLQLDPATRKITTYVHRDDFNQPNDLAITRDDVVFASDPHWASGTGKLWRIDRGPAEGTGTAVLLEDKMGTTNGIELSPDERTLYVAESVQRRIWAYDVDAKHQISNKRLLIALPDYGLDGIKCDREGALYVTRHGKGTIAVVSPRGEIVREIRLKGTKPSNLVFGGTDGRTVFVTLQDRGAIETFRTDVPGRTWK